MKFAVGVWILALVSSPTVAQVFTEKISKEYSFEKRGAHNALVVANINGSVKVEGYNGDKILVEVTKRIQGKTQARLDRGVSEIQLGVLDLADTIILYVQGHCGGFTRYGHQRKGSSGNTWGYDWNKDCRDDQAGYDFKMDFVVRVPAELNLNISTINEGEVFVDAVSGMVIANNINGGIQLRGLMQRAVARTINGDVDIDYTRNPKEHCEFYSLNGDIRALFQKGLAASMRFESFNGDFFTNIDRLEPLPVEVEQTKTGNGVKYKVNGNRYRIGSGGANLDFETFNGNVYLKEKISP